MKACLMKVNYDPRYTAPHQLRTMDSFLMARETYGPGMSTVPVNQNKIHLGEYFRYLSFCLHIAVYSLQFKCKIVI